MSLGYGNKIVTNGLVFAYDMYLNDTWVNKSYKGKPTVNYAWAQNPRVDSSYTSYVGTTSGTWQSKHPKAITVYNKAGSNISAYINTGVTDWTNTYHAVWEFDSELRRPVVVMRDIGNGAWLAKNFGLGKTYTQMGLTNGDTYTISWLQWTSNISKSAQAGLYGTNTSGTNGFHDGQSLSKGATAYNTKPYTWQRVYAIFTVAATNNLTTNRSCYMYGMFNGRGVLKIADVQIEAGVPSTFIAENSEVNSTRSNTGVILDWTGNNTVTADSLIYNNDGTVSFDGTTQDNYCTITSGTELSAIRGTSNISVEAWVYYTSYSGGTESYSVITCWGAPWVWLLENPSNRLRFRITAGGADVNIADTSTHPLNTWIQVVGTYDGSTKKIYVNGVLKNSSAQTGVLSSPGGTPKIGTYQGTNYCMSGKIDSVKIYNRALTANEVAQNFEAHRGRYGI